MGIKIGRLGIDVAVDDVSDWVENGDSVSLMLELTGTTTTELVQQRQRALALVDNVDEPVVPLTWTEEASRDGYYRVTQVSCPIDASALTALQVPCQMTLERIPSWQAPLFESRTIGLLRTNVHSITSSSTRPFLALPNDADGIDGFTESQADVQSLTADGSVTMKYITTNGADRNELWSNQIKYFVPPANYYDGAARIEVESNEPIIGRQAQNEPTDWMLTNDLIRVSTGSTAGEFDFEYYDGAAWRTKTFRLYEETAGSLVLATHPHTFTVLRNSPEACAVRLHVTGTAIGTLSTNWAYNVDFLIRRGSRILEGYFNAGTIIGNWGVELATAEAGTDITGAIRASANDANGDRYLIFCPATYTIDGTQGGLHLSTGFTDSNLAFGVGIQVDGSSAAYPFTDTEMLGAYYGPVGEYQKLAVR